MASTKQETDGAGRLIGAVEDAAQATLESVRRFVDTVSGAFPDLSEDGPRQKIIDAAFKMVEQVVGETNGFAKNIVHLTEGTLHDLGEGTRPATK